MATIEVSRNDNSKPTKILVSRQSVILKDVREVEAYPMLRIQKRSNGNSGGANSSRMLESLEPTAMVSASSLLFAFSRCDSMANLLRSTGMRLSN